MPGGHGAGSTLRNNGNDGFAEIDEDADGNVVITVDADSATLARVIVRVNGKDISAERIAEENR